MTDRQRALLSLAIGVVCALSAVRSPFGIREALGLAIGAGNLLMAVWLYRDAA